MPRLVAPNGVAVDVADEKVARLLDRGFTVENEAPSKKASTHKSEK